MSLNKQKVEGVCFTGDVMLSRGVAAFVKKTGKDYLFAKIKPLLERYKYRFINLECPLTPLHYPPNKPYSFRADSSSVGILTSAGITHATLANNHIDDQTTAGAGDTYRILADNGIVGIGLKKSGQDTCNPAEILVGGRKIAVFAALGIDMNSPNEWYCLDSLFIRSIQIYKKANRSAYVICYLHWGIEYRKFSSRKQEEIARKLIDAGADMIIGHHPHVIESIRYYRGKPILYSLGNLVFDQHDPDTKKGIIAGLMVRDTTVKIDLMPYDIVRFRPVPIQAWSFQPPIWSIWDNE